MLMVMVKEGDDDEDGEVDVLPVQLPARTEPRGHTRCTETFSFFSPLQINHETTTKH